MRMVDPHHGCRHAREAGTACLRLPCTPGTRSRLLRGSGGKPRRARRQHPRPAACPVPPRPAHRPWPPRAPRLPARGRAGALAGEADLKTRPRRAPRVRARARASTRQCRTVAARILAARGALPRPGLRMRTSRLTSAALLSLRCIGGPFIRVSGGCYLEGYCRNNSSPEASDAFQKNCGKRDKVISSANAGHAFAPCARS